jgi:RPA family protein
MEFKRMPAVKTRIVDIVNGKYFSAEKEKMKAAFVVTSFGQKISRVNLIATVIDKFVSEDGNYCSLTLDDGTSLIKSKTFKEDTKILKDYELGDLILLIGKLREYNGEVYINAEATRKVMDANFEILRRFEILQELRKKKKMTEEIKNLANQISEEELREYSKKKYNIDENALQVIRESSIVEKVEDYKPALLEVINKLDDGKGVEINKIFEVANLPESVIEHTLNELLANGSLYEPTVGILKIIK